MNIGQSPDSSARPEVAALAGRFIAFLPRLDTEGRKVAIALYRQLALGDAVASKQVALRSGVGLNRVNALLDDWPAVFREEGKVIGFWGLTIRPLSRHRFQVEERTLYTWCAWDALFLPAILGKTAHVGSQDAVTGDPIRLTVHSDGVEGADPASTVISMLEPREEMLDNVVARLCHFIHFFASPQSGAAWVREHPDTVLMRLEDAFELSRRTNEGRYGEALRVPPEH